MGKDAHKKSTVELRNVEARAGCRTNLTAREGILYQVKKKGGHPLPPGVLALSENDRVILRYPDGTEIVISEG
jgi:hypothetical protein